jgi:hypothetical protein
MLTGLKRGMNSTRGNEGACPLVHSRAGSWGPGKKKEVEKMKKNYKLQNTNYKGGGTPGLLRNLNYNVQNNKQKNKGGHGLHRFF